MSKTISATVDVDVDLDDFDDEEIRAEYHARNLADDEDFESRDVLLLAEMIADNDAALRLLAEIHPGEFQPATIKMLAAGRQKAVA